MSKKRVVITGIGLITPIGSGVNTFWEAALRGENGVRPLQNFDATEFKTKTGGEVLDFNPADFFNQSELSRMGRSSQFAVAATKMALEDARIDLANQDTSRIGISIGTTMGEPQILEQGIRIKYDTGDADQIPTTLPRQYPCSSIPAHIAETYAISGPHIMIPLLSIALVNCSIICLCSSSLIECISNSTPFVKSTDAVP